MTRRYNSKETIELILSASMKLFNERGFDKTSMQAIVDKSGVSKGSIFHHFISKEDILMTVIIRKAETEHEQISKWLGEIKNMTAKEKLTVFLDKLFEDINTEDGHLNSQVLRSPQMVLITMQKSLKITAPIYANLFKEGVKDGSISTELPDQCAEALVLLMNFWCNTVIFECDKMNLFNRILFIQQMMRELGADIISDQHISQIMKLSEKLSSRIPE